MKFLEKYTLNSFLPYLKVLRLDHSIKHLFVLPGIFFCFLLSKNTLFNYSIIFLNSTVVFIALILAGSANYLINEMLDRKLDSLHPLKQDRVLAKIKLNSKLLITEYVFLSAIALFFSILISKANFYITLLFLISGLLYNVEPFRLKDKAVFDILSESINNPIRMLAGWFALSSQSTPPISLFLSFWALGSFMMSIKRLAEFIHMNNLHEMSNLKIYRKSFKFWNSHNLTIFLMGSISVFFFSFSAFLLKYRLEYCLLLPLLIMQTLWYYDISIKNSNVKLNIDDVCNLIRMLKARSTRAF